MGDDDSPMELSEFLAAFPIPLQHHRTSDQSVSNSVFWSGSENSSSSADLGTPITNKIHDKIKSVLCNLKIDVFTGPIIAQFWAPVEIGGRRLLSTSGQPFFVTRLSNEIVTYRLHTENRPYNIHVNYKDGPANVFLAHLPCIQEPEWITSEGFISLNRSFMFPIGSRVENASCIGVLEITMASRILYSLNFRLRRLIMDIKFSLQDVALDIIEIQHLIPYESINGLKLTKEKIKDAIKAVCASRTLYLAQVWITYEDKSMVPHDTQTKHSLALKLTGHFQDLPLIYIGPLLLLSDYFNLCDVFPVSSTEPALKTLQDYKSRYISKLHSDDRLNWQETSYEVSALVICLRSIHTGDVDYAFEFLWNKHRSSATVMFESILTTLKELLPSFKFSSGEQLDEESDVIDVTEIESTSIKIFHGNRLSTIPKPFEEGKKHTVEMPSFKFASSPTGLASMDLIDNFEASEILENTIEAENSSSPMPDKGKKLMLTDTKNMSRSKGRGRKVQLSYEEVEEQFGKPMDEAAINLGVGPSTLYRWWKRNFQIPGKKYISWPGPRSNKEKENDSSTIHIDTVEDVAIQEPSTDNIIIEATYENDTIKFPLNISEATFVTIEEKIRNKFQLSVGTYKLKYTDENKRNILLTSDDDEMGLCIESSRKSDGRIVVQLIVNLIN